MANKLDSFIKRRDALFKSVETNLRILVVSAGKPNTKGVDNCFEVDITDQPQTVIYDQVAYSAQLVTVNSGAITIFGVDDDGMTNSFDASDLSVNDIIGVYESVLWATGKMEVDEDVAPANDRAPHGHFYQCCIEDDEDANAIGERFLYLSKAKKFGNSAASNHRSDEGRYLSVCLYRVESGDPLTANPVVYIKQVERIELSRI